MEFDQIIAIATFGQFIVVAAAAVFAFLQFRDFGRQQTARVVQHVFEELNKPEIAAGLDFVYNQLPGKLAESAYVREIAEGKATVATHRELFVMHFFNELGLLVHEKLISEMIVPFVASPCIRAWDKLVPVVELMRRHYPHAYTPFESLVARARAVDLAAINNRFRSETPQLRAQWDQSARELTERRNVLLDQTAGKSEGRSSGGS